MKKLDARVFLEAAERLTYFRDAGACHAISKITKSWVSKERSQFEKLLKPNSWDRSSLWYGEYSSENKLARQLGLLFCAEVLKDEQRKRK